MKTKIYNMQELTSAQLTHLAAELSAGAVAVFATDTVYGIGTGALCEESIARIYALKKRPATQPLQLLAADFMHVEQWAKFSPGARHVAQVFWPGALTLIVPPSAKGKKLLRGSKALGFRVPAYLPLLRILAQMPMPLASTSANVHGSPTLTQEEEVVKQFNTKVEYILTDGTLSPVASSVLDATSQTPKLLRAGGIAQEELRRVFEDAQDFV